MEKPRAIELERAVLVSELIRSESGVPDISQEDAIAFVWTVLKTCNICIPYNIKPCSAFITKNILGSKPRVTALMKYLTLLSMSFGPRDLAKRVNTMTPLDANVGLGNFVPPGRLDQPPKPASKRLHILHIVNDVFYYMMHHVKNAQAVIREQFRWKVSTLMELAVCHCCGEKGETLPQVRDMLDRWQTLGIFDSATCAQQRDNISLAADTEWDALVNTLKINDGGNRANQRRRELAEWRSTHFPMSHGIPDDPNAPWHELPATNGLYMVRTEGWPLRMSRMPRGGYAVAGGGQSVDLELKQDVAHLYAEMIHCYDKHISADAIQDIDALGNIIWKDPERPTRNCWGFTLDGIDKRKELAKQFAAAATNGSSDRAAPVNDAVERARALATERERGSGNGNDVNPERDPRRGGFRGGRRW